MSGGDILVPFVLSSFSNSIYLRWSNQGLILLFGLEAKKIIEQADVESQTLKNVKGFERIVLKLPKLCIYERYN